MKLFVPFSDYPVSAIASDVPAVNLTHVFPVPPVGHLDLAMEGRRGQFKNSSDSPNELSGSFKFFHRLRDFLEYLLFPLLCLPDHLFQFFDWNVDSFRHAYCPPSLSYCSVYCTGNYLFCLLQYSLEIHTAVYAVQTSRDRMPRAPSKHRWARSGTSPPVTRHRRSTWH